MPIPGDESVTVIYFDHFAIPAFAAFHRNHTIGGGSNRRAKTGGNV
jgi:hypothetical protein